MLIFPVLGKMTHMFNVLMILYMQGRVTKRRKPQSQKRPTGSTKASPLLLIPLGVGGGSVVAEIVIIIIPRKGIVYSCSWIVTNNVFQYFGIKIFNLEVISCVFNITLINVNILFCNCFQTINFFDNNFRFQGFQ